MWRAELAQWKRYCLEWPLYALLLLTLLGALAAYQGRRSQFVDVGGIHDAPYLSNFYEPEKSLEEGANLAVDFRWTRDQVEMDFLGLGRQAMEVRLRMQAFRPAGQPAPQVSLWVGGVRLLAAPVGSQWQTYEALLPADLVAAGDLHLQLRSDTFQPATDTRILGVSLDWVEVRPAGLGWVGPAGWQIGGLLGATLCAYLMLRRWGLRRRWSIPLVALGVGLLAFLLAYQRLWLTCFTFTLVVLLASGLLLTALFLPLLERRFWRESQVGGGDYVAAGGARAAPLPGQLYAWKQARLLWAILLLGSLLRLGGMLYPQFRSSDLLLHVHNAESVRSGNLIFTEPLPDINLPVPYPPGFYLAMMPATLLSSDLVLPMEIAGVVLDALAGLLLYLLARRLSGRSEVAWLALLLQQVAPVTFMIFSWGNYTNMFSRTALLAALVLLAVGRWRWGEVRGWALLSGVFVLVLLGHFADSLLFAVFVLAVMALGLFTAAGRRAMPALLAALLVAGGLALGLYYSAPAAGESLLEGLGVLLQGQGPPASLGNPLHQVLEQIQTPLVLLALPGLALLWRRSRGWPMVVLGGALLTALAFAFGQAFFGISSRYNLFVLPVLALGTARVLVGLWRRGWAGRLAVAALVGFLLWNGLLKWGELIGFAYH